MKDLATLEIPKEVYKALNDAAGATGKTPIEWITTQLRQTSPSYAEEYLRRAIPAEIYAFIEQRAEKVGMQSGVLAERWLAKYGHKPPPKLTDEEWQIVQERIGKPETISSLKAN